MKALALVSFLALVASCASAPSLSREEQGVIGTVQAFFDAIESGDAQAGASLTIPEGVFVNVSVKDGKRSLNHFSNADWLAGMEDSSASYFEAFDGEPLVRINGDVAVVWARYVFDIDGERSHTGIDLFNLVRTDSGWKICGGAYSVVR